MPERVWVNREARLVEVSSEGVVTEAENAAGLREVLAQLEATGFRRVLADTRKQVAVPSIFAILKFGENLPRGIAFALVVESSQPTAEVVDLLRVIARSRGACIDVFSSREQALDWVLAVPLPPDDGSSQAT